MTPAPEEKRKYWYKTTVYFCPVCDRREIVKERTYWKTSARWFYKQDYDWCDVRAGLYV